MLFRLTSNVVNEHLDNPELYKTCQVRSNEDESRYAQINQSGNEWQAVRNYSQYEVGQSVIWVFDHQLIIRVQFLEVNECPVDNEDYKVVAYRYLTENASCFNQIVSLFVFFHTSEVGEEK